MLLCNIFLILAMIISVWIYSGYISKSQSEIKRTDFIRTIESMKRVSQNYLNEEKGYMKDWAAYYPKGEEQIDTYVQYKDKDTDVPFGTIMEHMFTGTGDRFEILGKYRLQETKSMAVGIYEIAEFY